MRNIILTIVIGLVVTPVKAEPSSEVSWLMSER